MIEKETFKKFGLVGRNIDYSFSRKYFSKKFKTENRLDLYVNFDIPTIDSFRSILKQSPNLSGLNITIPYKKAVIPFLDRLSKEATKIQAVNTIVWDSYGKTIGHNTDHIGFEKALLEFMKKKPTKVLILGTGGASSAVKFVLEKLGSRYQFVSRKPKKNQISYDQLTKNHIIRTDLIVNTTPLGTFPKTKEFPPLPYKYLNTNHFLFDLIYNPNETEFLRKGKFQGAKICNGYKMLVYQAEKSWELWNQ